MSAQHNDGGPAFPGPVPGLQIYDGMSLRDYFAAQALQALLMGGDITLGNAATQAYKAADDMLLVRSIPRPPMVSPVTVHAVPETKLDFGDGA